MDETEPRKALLECRCCHLFNHMSNFGRFSLVFQCAQKEGFEMVQIQSDCAEAVDIVNNPNASRNPLSLVRIIDAIGCSARAIDVVWTPRECNKPADYLPITTTPHSLELIYLSLPPAEVISLLEQDSVAAPLLQ
ncbi:hypothetical protein F3Y22_tig00113338pilonHSYRG00011 [Hibiscus syriacus]|uniref:RNase H type-1 domain-containing protein n=1 Tax=Hibiscus syriacus TaxID=106335 RepID=A0A6A2WP86_HIBSY|nr:hypothetical protein F3Y22_tig00113338pilonHSYRG00011 [Hibiscus syriacus]